MKRGLALFLTVVAAGTLLSATGAGAPEPDDRRRPADDDQLARPQQGRVARDRGDRSGRIRRRAPRSADHHHRLPQRDRRAVCRTPSRRTRAVRLPASPWNRWNRSARPPRACASRCRSRSAHHVRSDRNTIVIDLDKPTGQPYVLPAVAEQSNTANGQPPDAMKALEIAQSPVVDPLAVAWLDRAARGAPQTTGAPALSVGEFATATASAAAARAGPGGHASPGRQGRSAFRTTGAGAGPGRPGRNAIHGKSNQPRLSGRGPARRAPELRRDQRPQHGHRPEGAPARWTWRCATSRGTRRSTSSCAPTA